MTDNSTDDDKTNPNTEDKMSWAPDDVQWTKSPSAAQRLANRVPTRRSTARPKTSE